MLHAEILHEDAVIQRGTYELVDGRPCIAGWHIDGSKLPPGENAVYFHDAFSVLGEEEPA